MVKRFIFTLLVSVSGFAGMVSLADPDARYGGTSLDRAQGQASQDQHGPVVIASGPR